MFDDNNFFQCPNVAALKATANVYNSFYPIANVYADPVNCFGRTDMSREKLDPKVSVKLEGIDLWKRFCSFGTEMIITKKGRRLFPNFCVSVSNLDPTAHYVFLLDIVPVDDNRYKYQESTWVISGKAEPHLYGRYYIHLDSPQTGAQWMKQSILFNKVKITNNPMQSSSQILLNSMHRYIPRLHIIQAADDYSIRTGPLSTFIFDETVFIAVTAYQNDQIKNLKIDNNPFAKGFREPTHGKKNSSVCLKRLQSSLSLNKYAQHNNKQSNLCNNDSSLLSSNSDSPNLHKTTFTNNQLDDQEQNSDAPVLNLPSIYTRPYSYENDSSPMIYNPATYAYMGSTAGAPMNFSYAYYPTSIYASNNYNAPFF